MTEYITYNALENNGRLGNQMWQIAWMFGEGLRTGRQPKIREDWSYRPYFSIPDRYFAPMPPDSTLDGGTAYFQEYKNFSNVEKQIRLMYEPSDLVSGFLTSQWGHLLQHDWCAVHVRRGDYLNNPHLFPQMTSKYYHDAVDDVKSRNPNIRFAVFSDDIQWCQDNPDHFGFGESEVSWVVPHVTPVEVAQRTKPRDQLDLFFMALFCKEHIISNSTFSWWGAFLSGNPAPIYPSLWFGPQIPEYATMWNAFPESWRKFEC